jgi:hypothetical protein
MDNRFQRIVIYSLISCVCSVLVGLIFYQGDVFLRTHYAFQFITAGIIGSVFFNLLRFGRMRDAMAGLFTMLIIQLLITRSSTIVFLVRDIVYVAAIGVAIYLFYANYFKQGRGGGLLTPVLIGMLLGGTNLVAIMILLVVSGHPMMTNVGSMLLTVILGILIGFGIGTGILISDKVDSLHRVSP